MAQTGTGGNLALYRKYRSATFTDVIGQDHVTKPLRVALANGRINHAYLFSGPRGCGKTSSARILARSLNCGQGPTPDPCGVCDSCVELAPNGPGSIDVIEIDAASHGGVDDARDLRERAFFAPVRDRFKVYIIDEAHMVTTQGFNALLKLVEEPPDFLIFVFATTEPDKVLPTIRSRTHHYPFRLIPPGVMRAHLEAICAREGIAVEPAVLPLVVRAGGGSARDSLSILDQLLAGAHADGLKYADAVALLGVTDRALLDDMVDALAAGDAAAVYATVDRVVEAGHDPRRFAADLLDRFRDLILVDAVPDALERGLIDAPGDDAARLFDQAAKIGAASLTRYAEIVHTALLEMRGTTSPRLVLELLCARMLLPDASADSAALLQRLERVERRLSASSSVQAGPRPDPPVPPARSAAPARSTPEASVPSSSASAPSGPPPLPEPLSEPAPSAPELPHRQPPSTSAPEPPPPPAVSTPVAAPAAGDLDAAALRRVWPDALDRVKAGSKTTWAMLDGAQITEVSGSTIVLAVAPSLAKRIAEERHSSLIASAVGQLITGNWRVSVVANATAPAAIKSAALSVPATSSSEPDPRDDPDFDPTPAPSAPIDPEAEALRLLQDRLGARPVE